MSTCFLFNRLLTAKSYPMHIYSSLTHSSLIFTHKLLIPYLSFTRFYLFILLLNPVQCYSVLLISRLAHSPLTHYVLITYSSLSLSQFYSILLTPCSNSLFTHHLLIFTHHLLIFNPSPHSSLSLLIVIEYLLITDSFLPLTHSYQLLIFTHPYSSLLTLLINYSFLLTTYSFLPCTHPYPLLNITHPWLIIYSSFTHTDSSLKLLSHPYHQLIRITHTSYSS